MSIVFIHRSRFRAAAFGAAAVLSLTLLPVSKARAWNAAGHEQIADIAWTLLSPGTKQKVAAILMGGDPAYRPKSDSEADRRSAFVKASTFADHIKKNHDTVYDYGVPSLVEKMNRKWIPVLDPGDNQQIRCETWHYFDTPIRVPPAMHPASRASNGILALTFAETQIPASSRTSRSLKAWWLYWIEHLVGDLHQPLHCATSYQSNANGDGGGNGFTLGIDDPESHNKMSLHSYWDAGITHARAAEAADGGEPDGIPDVTKRWTGEVNALGPKTHADFAAGVKDIDPTHWVRDAAVLADTVSYNGIKPNEMPGGEYDKEANRVCKQQAKLAGYRLARILTEILGQ